MNPTRLFPVASLIALVLHVPVAVACSCLPNPPPAEALKAAGAVFLGKVTAIDRGAGQFAGLTVTIEVDRTWKGPGEKTLTVNTASDGAMCGFTFEVGKSYVVYAHAEGKALSTSICTRTAHVDAAGEDLKALGEGKKPGAKG
ncbi:MAG TPA: hypothetical protein VEA69_03280 [Tepidisphaeraceae bacterium]|nr:hypothetical protein [Tepidisphaeraceae bacterium]